MAFMSAMVRREGDEEEDWEGDELLMRVAEALEQNELAVPTTDANGEGDALRLHDCEVRAAEGGSRASKNGFSGQGKVR